MAKTGNKNKINVSLSTVDDCRLPLYPVGRQKEKVDIPTNWGTVRFENGVPTATCGNK